MVKRYLGLTGRVTAFLHFKEFPQVFEMRYGIQDSPCPPFSRCSVREKGTDIPAHAFS